MGSGAFYLIKESGFSNPLAFVNKYAFYWFFGHLIIRYLFQIIPVMNIRPLVILPIKKSTLVHFILGKSGISFFNLLHAFFFIPFSIVLILNGYNVFGVITWYFGMMALVFSSNFVNVLANKQDGFLFFVATIVLALVASQYYNLFDITAYTQVFFDALYDNPAVVFLPILGLIGLYYLAFNYFVHNMYFDDKLATKQKNGRRKRIRLAQ